MKSDGSILTWIVAYFIATTRKTKVKEAPTPTSTGTHVPKVCSEDQWFKSVFGAIKSEILINKPHNIIKHMPTIFEESSDIFQKILSAMEIKNGHTFQTVDATPGFKFAL